MICNVCGLVDSADWRNRSSSASEDDGPGDRDGTKKQHITCFMYSTHFRI